jgi:hypothetical protein
MRKVLILSLVLINSLIYAQITITTEDIGGPGAVFVMGNDEDATGQINLGNPGANQNWDFSTLDNDDIDTIRFHEPAGFPFWEEYPEANILVEMDADSTYAYTKKTEDDYTVLGIVARNDMTGIISLPMSPPLYMVDFPMNYQDTLEQNAEQIAVFDSPVPPADSVKIEVLTEDTRIVDAWGSLQLPWYTFDVLRVDAITITQLTVYGKIFGNWTILEQSIDTSFSYEFWTDHSLTGYILCTVDYDPSSGEIDNVEYMSKFAIYVGQNELASGIKTVVYPVPANDMVNFQFGNEFSGKIEISDLSGRMVMQKEIIRQSNVQVDIKKLKTGLYLWTAYDKNCDQIASDKIIIE